MGAQANKDVMKELQQGYIERMQCECDMKIIISWNPIHWMLKGRPKLK